MSQSRKREAPAGYRLRVAGHLDHHWSPWFGDLTLTHEDDGTTSLTGVVSDQAELHGLLAKVRDLGVTLISVTAISGRVAPAESGPLSMSRNERDGSRIWGEAHFPPEKAPHNRE